MLISSYDGGTCAQCPPGYATVETVADWLRVIPRLHELASLCKRGIKLFSAAGSKKFFFAISKWRMASSVLPKTFRNHDNLNCDRIFRAKRQLSLSPLNRTIALPAALSNLTRPGTINMA